MAVSRAIVSTESSLAAMLTKETQQAARSGRGAEMFSFEAVPVLSAALRQGDEAAFLWLHAQWSRRILRYSYAVGRGDETLAEEIAQAVWRRLARHVRVLPDEAALWSWIAQAARHAAADLQRMGGRYRCALARFTEWLRPPAVGVAADADAGEELLAVLDRALGRLNEDERAVVEARYFEGEALAQTAARLGVTTRAVEGRLARARLRLKELVRHELQSTIS